MQLIDLSRSDLSENSPLGPWLVRKLNSLSLIGQKTHLSLPDWSGMPKQTSRSNRPARLRAGSMESGRFVAPITKTWHDALLLNSEIEIFIFRKY